MRTDDSNSEARAHAAEELQMTEGAARVAVHRLRQRYGELFRRAVGVPRPRTRP